MGDFIDDFMMWVIGGNYMLLGGQIIGLNYIVICDFIFGNMFGYIIFDYDGINFVVDQFIYEESGVVFWVGSIFVFEFGLLVLLGFGLFGFFFC